ncbi:hypothetical protein, conserved [Eimeria tenella]|uniref:Uncharacterized protein n=1 Tax=Eimeria tenella TaxID=5802 RepID=U6KJC3_EIMTE|nr:hypothetical protein, conserved [Eimeria tenella]CDJ38140.1 hypothetical protein, conserved [Eimeria tenella]|eukprot:XP_013228978.1 hypothetical protein, conserved [Eimeria tenella]
MQHLRKPQIVEVLLRLLVTSRLLPAAAPAAAAAAAKGLQRSSGAPLPLQLLAATATLGRPLHRRLANFVRWKQQQLLHAQEPPLQQHFVGSPSRCSSSSSSSSRQAWAGAFATPQQRMRAAFMRLAARGLLGLPKFTQAPEGPPGGPPGAPQGAPQGPPGGPRRSPQGSPGGAPRDPRGPPKPQGAPCGALWGPPGAPGGPQRPWRPP